MAQAQPKRPVGIRPLNLENICGVASGERTVGGKDSSSPHSRLHSPSGKSQTCMSPCPSKRRRKSSRELVQEALDELRRDHAFGPDKIIVGGSVSRPSSQDSPRRFPALALKLQRQRSSKSTPPAIDEEEQPAGHQPTQSDHDNPPGRVAQEEQHFSHTIEHTPRTILSDLSSGRNTPRDLDLDANTCQLQMKDLCLQVDGSETLTASDEQKLEAIQVREMRLARDQEQELARLRLRIQQLEEERQAEFAQMKAAALEDVMDLMVEMQRSHEEVEHMFSARIELLETRMRVKEHECLELAQMVGDRDVDLAERHGGKITATASPMAPSDHVRRRAWNGLVGFLAERTVNLPALHSLTSFLAVHGTAAAASGSDAATATQGGSHGEGMGSVLAACSVSVVGALQVEGGSTSEMLPPDGGRGRPYMAYVVRCSVDAGRAEGAGEGEEGEQCEFCVLRRFSDCVALWTRLSQTLPRHTLRSLPPLPPKRWFRPCSQAVVSERLRGLSTFLQALPEVCQRCDAAAEIALDFLVGRDSAEGSVEHIESDP